jgi:hypothetical protein
MVVIGTMLFIPLQADAGSGKKALALGMLTTGATTAVIVILDPKDHNYHNRFQPGEITGLGLGAGMIVGSIYYLLAPESQRTSSAATTKSALLTLGKEGRQWRLPPLSYQGSKWHVPLVSVELEFRPFRNRK